MRCNRGLFPLCKNLRCCQSLVALNRHMSTSIWPFSQHSRISWQGFTAESHLKSFTLWRSQSLCRGRVWLYSISQTESKYMLHHRDTHKLKNSGPCPAQLIYIWPTNDDGHRWIGIKPGLKHNHSKPAHVIPQETKHKIKTALTSDSTHMTKDLQKGFGVAMVPGELSPAAANPQWLRKKNLGPEDDRWQ